MWHGFTPAQETDCEPQQEAAAWSDVISKVHYGHNDPSREELVVPNLLDPQGPSSVHSPHDDLVLNKLN